MRTRSPSSAARALLVLLCVTWTLACGEQAPPPPNVVVIVIDTLRADRMPFHGGPAENAPFLAELARDALVFENAWATSSWTAPSTASIFTGLYPNEHGLRLGLRAGTKRQKKDPTQALDRIPDELPTLPTLMKARGYRTFGATANPNIDARLGFERGFDFFAPYDWKSKQSAKPVVDKILAWRDEILAGAPFFLYIHLADPHGPYTRHAEFIRDDSPPPEKNLDDLVAYDSEIRFADEQLRRLFRELGIGDETIVVMTADHGQEFMDHGQRGHGWQLYSELTRVPLFVRYPSDVRLRGRAAANVSNADIAATLGELVGSAGGDGPGGRSLFEQLAPDLGDRAVFAMRKQDDGVKPPSYLHAVVSGHHKLIAHLPEARFELYHLAEDPAEQNDIASERPEIVAEMVALMTRQQKDARASGHHSQVPYTPGPEMTELLEELGYVEDGPNLAPR